MDQDHLLPKASSCNCCSAARNAAAHHDDIETAAIKRLFGQSSQCLSPGAAEDAARQLGKSGDGGIDGVVDEDRLGLDRIYVQAKRYAPGSSVGRPVVQGFVGSLVGVGASKGVFVTTSTFSSHAIGYADGLPQRVVLIDGARLTELMIEFGVGVRESRSIQVKRLDEDFFSGE